MHISSREKQSFYEGLAALLRNGVPFPAAIQKLSTTARGSLRKLLQRLAKAVQEGKTVGEAFSAQSPTISKLEANVLAALERSGGLDRGCFQLGAYFAAFATARQSLRRKLAYPLFLLHFGVLSLSLPTWVTHGLVAYVNQTLPLLIGVDGCLMTLVLLLPSLSDLGRSSVFFDQILRSVPVFGKVRQLFASARFCLIYGLTLDAGINVIDALVAAGHASGSGRIAAATRSAIEAVRSGQSVGPALAQSSAFSDELARSLLVGEETGQLDAELRRWAAQNQEEAFLTLDNAIQWCVKLLSIAVMAFVGWKIVHVYQGVLNSMEELTKF